MRAEFNFVSGRSVHLLRGIPSALFLSGFPKKCCISYLSRNSHTLCSCYCLLFDLSHEWFRFTLLVHLYHHSNNDPVATGCEAIHFIPSVVVTSANLNSYILISTILTNTGHVCSFIRIRDQVKHPDTTGKTVILYFNFLDVFI
jgi:hypothetical protein